MMDSPGTTVTIDSLIMETGNCGLFQLLVVITVHGAALPVKWSSGFMQYGVYNPGWTCTDQDTWEDRNKSTSASVSPGVNVSGNRTSDDVYTSSCDVYEHCQNVVYSNESSTIVTEWNLACDKTWITSMIISLEVAGQTIGTFLAGVLNDKMGRKPTHILSLALLAVFNLVAMFSTSWPMFMVIRFFVGIFGGCVSFTNFMYPVEFLTDKWRAIVSALPFTSFGSTTFALITLWIKDWRYIHLMTSVFSLALLVSMLWMPESIRWLVMRGETEKAVQAVHKIERINKTEAKSMAVIYSRSEIVPEERDNKKTCSILDLYRRGFWKRTLVITFTWIRINVCNTIILFGINALSGDFYVNLFLFSSISIATSPLLPLFTHLLGRRLSSFIFLGSLCLSLFCLVLLDFLTLDVDKGLAISMISLLVSVFIDAEWSVLMLRCVEVYPTNLRSLSYGYANTLAKIGGILAPFLIPHDEHTLFISHIVMAVLTLLNLPALWFLPETKGRPMDDYQELK